MVREHSKTHGYSLIEMMVVISCSVVLSLAMMQGYTLTFRLYIKHIMMLEVQNSARLVEMVLSKAVRTSGNFGCAGFGSNTVLHVHSGLRQAHGYLNLTERVKGLTLASLIVSDAMRPRLKENSDALYVLGLKKTSNLMRASKLDTNVLLIQGKSTIKENRLLALCNCSHIDVTRVTGAPKFNAHTNTSTFFIEPFTQGLSTYYGEQSWVGELSMKQFYVAKTQRNENREPIYALYESDINGLTYELIEGVEHMQLTFSKEKNNPQNFLAKEQVNNWSDIQMVQACVKISSVTQLDGRAMTQWWQFRWAVYGLSDS